MKAVHPSLVLLYTVDHLLLTINFQLSHSVLRPRFMQSLPLRWMIMVCKDCHVCLVGFKVDVYGGLQMSVSQLSTNNSRSHFSKTDLGNLGPINTLCMSRHNSSLLDNTNAK